MIYRFFCMSLCDMLCSRQASTNPQHSIPLSNKTNPCTETFHYTLLVVDRSKVFGARKASMRRLFKENSERI